MLCITKTNKIVLTKGDTASLQIEVIDCDGNEYKVKENDVLTFRVRKTPNSDVVINKTANKDNIIIINPSDTYEIASGLYVYDVQIITQYGNTYTVIPLNYFELEEEIC